MDPTRTTPLNQDEGFEIELQLSSTRFGLQPVAGLRLKLIEPNESVSTDRLGKTSGPCPTKGESIRVNAVLATERFQVQGRSRIYEIEFNLVCGQRNFFLVPAETHPGQVLSIFRIFSEAEYKLGSTVSLSFWQRILQARWPSDADYYSWGIVHLTRGDHWDVVGHELGHALYDLGQLGRMGGGPHKIDECYSGALALSEGWASYFSAWLSLDLSDSDARFEYMVPRRAPIRIENVPSDVCPGPTNEWRTSAFFWDLIDSHNDGEGAKASFQGIWSALLRSRSENVETAARRIENEVLNRDFVRLVWDLNFLTSAPF